MSHRWKLFIAVAVVMLALTGVWVATTSLEPSNDLESYKKMLVANGEKLEISEVLPPSVPPEQNGADVVKQASTLLLGTPRYMYSNDPPAMRMIAPGKAIVSFEQPDVRFDNITNSWSNVMEAAEADRPATEQLSKVLNFPAIDFDITNGYGSGQIFESLSRSSYTLSAETICSLHGGDTKSAATNLYVLLALAYEEQNGPLPVYYRIIHARLAAYANWELLQSTNVDDAELAMIQKGWERLEFVHSAEKMVLIERAFDESEIKKMRSSNEELNHYMWPRPGGGNFWENVRRTAVMAAWQESWTYSDELQMLRNDQIVLEAIRTVATNGCFEPVYTNMLNQLNLQRTNEPENFLTRWDFMSLHRLFSRRSESAGWLFVRAMDIEVTRKVVDTAIALKRYQLEHRNYPATLSALIPEFLSSVPLDPMDGKPLRYRLNKDGTFLLYSIGANGKDDGGDPSNTRTHARYDDWLDPDDLDWVWPQPATKAEIEYFYAHPPK